MSAAIPPPASTSSAPPTRPPPATAKSHQSGPIAQHWNDLPSSFLSAPSSRTSSKPGSRSVSPSSRRPASSTSGTSSVTSATSTSEPGDAAMFDDLVGKLFGEEETRSSLPANVRKSLKSAVEKAAPTIKNEHKAEIAAVLRRLLVERCVGPQDAREEVIAFLRRNMGEEGIATWVPKVRQGVESVLI